MKVKILQQSKKLRLLICLLFLIIYHLPSGIAGTNGWAEKIQLEEAFMHIGQEYGVYFNYDREIVSDIIVVYEQGKYRNIQEALNAVFSQTELHYQIFDERYVAVYQETEQGIQSMKKMIAHFQGIVDEKENKTRPVVKKVQLLTRRSIHEFTSKRLIFSVSGTVTDREGEFLIGVNIQVRGTNKGTATDFEGNFTLDDIDENAVLVVSYIGYQSQEVLVAGKSNLSITLISDSQLLDEVVVVGYGTQKKSDLTGAISSVSKDDFNKGLVLSANQLIQGRAAGVNIVSTGGQPGGGSAINIRGLGSLTAGTNPLYVIDGLPIDNSQVISSTGEGVTGTRSPRDPLSSINPQDIESIEILKDASATAIYGSRGANGVIIITTKNGIEGQPKVNFSSSIGIQNRANKLDLLNAIEYQKFVNDVIDKGGATDNERVTEIQNGGTDWQDALSRKNAIIHDHNFSISGGSNERNYRVSLNYLDQDGIAISSAFERLGAGVSLNQKYRKFNFQIKLNTSYTKNIFIPNGFSGNAGSGAFYAATYFDPTISIYNNDGDFNDSPFLSLVNNPVALAVGTDSKSKANRTYGSVLGEYEFIPDLTASIRLGGDVTSENKDVYLDRRTDFGNSFGGLATKLVGKNTNALIEGLLRYNKSIGEQTINLVAGTSFQRFARSNMQSTGRGFPSDATKANNLSLADPQSYLSSSSNNENRLLAYLARMNYNLMNRYLLTLSFRADGSSRFGKRNKYGYFPSAAFAWKMDNESFFQSIDNVISTLKPRISWGITGNQAIGNYNSLVTFGAGGPTFLGEQPVSTIDPNRIPNPDLKWESTEQINLGLDFGLYGNRISGSVEWFNRVTSDMLLALPVPQSTGFSSQLTNVGKMSNNGLEVSLITRNITQDEFVWKSNIFLSKVINEVTDLGALDQIITGSAHFTTNIFLIKNGLPARSYYGYEIVGIWQEGDDFSQISNNSIVPGNLKYKDVNGDGEINEDDRVILGDSYPDLQFSLNNNFQYKNLQLNIFLDGAVGFEMLNNNLADTYLPVNVRRNRFSEPIINRWTPENPSNIYPSFVFPTTQGNKSVNSYTVEDASYLKLQSVSLVYNFATKSTRAINNFSISLTGQNLLTFTKYSGLDPSINPNGTGYSRIDFNAYPPAKVFTFGVNFEF